MKKFFKLALTIAVCLAAVFTVAFCASCAAEEPLEDQFVFTELSDGTYSIKAAKALKQEEKNKYETIEIPGSYNGKAVTVIEDEGFRTKIGCKKVVIGEGIKTIGYGAFAACGAIKEVIIPTSVTRILTSRYENVFENTVDTIYYNGTTAQWENIEGVDMLLDSIDIVCLGDN